MQLFVSAWVFIAEDDRSPTVIHRTFAEELMHSIKIKILALVLAWLSYIDSWTRTFRLHELKSI